MMKKLLVAVAVAAFLGLTASGAAAQDSDPGKSNKKASHHSLKHRKQGVHHRHASAQKQTHRAAHHRKHAGPRHHARARKHGGR